MRITMEFEVPAAVALQIVQLAANHTAQPMLVSDGPDQSEVNAEPAAPTDAESQAADDDGLPYGWTPEQLLRYHAESTDPQRGLLDYLAANPGTYVGSEELADNVAEINSFKSISGIVGGLNRRAKRYGASKSPVEWRKSEGFWQQRMPAAVADVIRQAAAE
jgi:Family of unknown function (DUF6416)